MCIASAINVMTVLWVMPVVTSADRFEQVTLSKSPYTSSIAAAILFAPFAAFLLCGTV